MSGAVESDKRRSRDQQLIEFLYDGTTVFTLPGMGKKRPSPASPSKSSSSNTQRQSSLSSSQTQKRSLSSSARLREEASAPAAGVPIGQIDQRLSLTFTCAVQDCGHRSTHEFSKASYTKGIVLVQCPGCKNR